MSYLIETSGDIIIMMTTLAI